MASPGAPSGAAVPCMVVAPAKLEVNAWVFKVTSSCNAGIWGFSVQNRQEFLRSERGITESVP